MNVIWQQTLGGECSFEGKGLHTGKYAKMTIKPAPENSGVVFHRSDLGERAFVEAIADNVSNTARSTTISCNGVNIVTIEHLMSALTGMGVDNALIEIDNEEIPILDGSARYFAEGIRKAGLVQQNAERRYITLTEELEISDPNTGSYVRLSPADKPEYDITVDFNSRVLGTQHLCWNPDIDFAGEISVCRTFVFFHEIEFLFQNNLVKGGDLDNAIVIVEHPATQEQIDKLSELFKCPELQVTEGGYLNNLKLHFKDECGRHKLLDLIGDLRLAGGFLKARITAFKPGHSINTAAAKAICRATRNQ